MGRDMSETVRVLHVLGGVGLGGAESRIMDLYRQMNRNEIQFDFLVHSSAVNSHKISPEKLRGDAFQSLHHAGVSGMRHCDGHSTALCDGQIDPRGRFNYQKNHPYLIDIFAKLCEIRPDAVLLLLGEGPDQRQR